MDDNLRLELKNKAYVYGYFEKESGDCIYIGIATTPIEERHQNHLKPSKYDVQEVNKWLQDNPHSWVIMKLGEIGMAIDISKELVHKLEMELVGTFNPRLNVYGM